MNQKTTKRIKRLLSRLHNGQQYYNHVRDEYIKLSGPARAIFLQELDKRTSQVKPNIK